ncbi:MAG TPA: hypothetical protein VGE43_04520 [Acidimicrobiales bacterium]
MSNHAHRRPRLPKPADPRPVDTSSGTFWNGQPTPARKVRVRVGPAERETHWHHGLEGTERSAVVVTYAGERFFLDDEDGSGWRKVTEGHGGPRWPHRSLPDDSTVVGAR